ncbi:MAG TPA: cation-translocating P-type ATPase [Chitinispirillaceae bacterium]|nr:cation-translocating P-type ATPase [Chitinispirillaceae bacterium]
MSGLSFENLKGLSDSEVKQRQMRDGFNELPSQGMRSSVDILLSVLKEPMFLLLISCGALYLLSGEFQEALMLLGFVFVIIGITFYQERKTERALEALKDLSSPRAYVFRNGEKVRIPGREVVCDDIILLSEGDRVPADCILLHALNFSVDESLLTGESVPVRKSATDNAAETALDKPGGDDLPSIFSGTLVVSGQAVGIAKTTGTRTELGKIGKALQSLQEERTPLQNQTGKVVQTFSIFGGVLCILVVIAYWFTRGNLLEGFLAGLSLAMAMLPEEFPVVLTVFLALGAWRISKYRVLTRRVPAVETLGSATVLCVDKTGTLTMNKMTITDIVAGDQVFTIKSKNQIIPENFHEVVEYSILASPVDPFDPMEKAMKELGESRLAQTEHIHTTWTLQREYPLSRELLAMSRVWISAEGDDFIIAAKGAPEAIADLCHFNNEQMKWLSKYIDLLSNQGKRVIGVAKARYKKSDLPGIQHDFHFEFTGLLGLEDPVRPNVKDAIQECYSAGIRTIMITGDYPGTAMSIARQIGLKNSERYITGPELEKLSDEQLAFQIRDVNVFARMVPEQKLRIVKAMKMNNEIVAMTGDGVNDAPALKAAHIGVAMGERGTDVAREAASLVLLDDDFNSIVTAVRMGRRIYDNLKKAMMYILSVHIPIAGLSLIPVLLNWPLILFPVHIVFLELIIDPACTLIFESDRDDRNVMKRKPRSIDAKLFDIATIFKCVFQGCLALIVTISIYMYIRNDHSTEAARALAFITLVICNLGMILSNRSLTRSCISMLKEKNEAFKWVISGTAVVMSLIMLIPFLKKLFMFGNVSAIDLLLSVAGGLITVAFMEIPKLIVFFKNRKMSV